MQQVKDFASRLNTIKTVITTLVVVLPIIGAYLGDFTGWASTMYNIKSILAETVTKSDSIEVLLYIEESLYDDVTVDQLAIRRMIEKTDMDESIRQELLHAHFASYNEKILKLERIRMKLKFLDPNWVSREDIKNGKAADSK